MCECKCQSQAKPRLTSTCCQSSANHSTRSFPLFLNTDLLSQPPLPSSFHSLTPHFFFHSPTSAYSVHPFHFIFLSIELFLSYSSLSLHRSVLISHVPPHPSHPPSPHLLANSVPNYLSPRPPPTTPEPESRTTTTP